MTRIALRDGHVDLERCEVVRGERRLQLTTAEGGLLAYLARHPNRDVPRDELHQHVWGHSAATASRAADYAVLRLRRKIELDPATPEVVLTVHGVGYRYVPVRPPAVPRGTGDIALIVALPVEAGDAAAQQRWLAAAVAGTDGADVVAAAPDRLVLASGVDAAAQVAERLHAAVAARIGRAEAARSRSWTRRRGGPCTAARCWTAPPSRRGRRRPARRSTPARRSPTRSPSGPARSSGARPSCAPSSTPGRPSPSSGRRGWASRGWSSPPPGP
ncbi:MAG: winged helix-turn-helix domain-containing protein [Myxococcota bacterium]